MQANDDMGWLVMRVLEHPGCFGRRNAGCEQTINGRAGGGFCRYADRHVGDDTGPHHRDHRRGCYLHISVAEVIVFFAIAADDISFGGFHRREPT